MTSLKLSSKKNNLFSFVYIVTLDLEITMWSERSRHKSHMVYDSIYMKHENTQIPRENKYIGGC